MADLYEGLTQAPGAPPVAATGAQSGLYGDLQEVAAPSAPRTASGLLEHAQAGFQQSVIGLGWRRKLPELVMDPQTAGWLERLATGVTQVASDLAIMIPAGMKGAAVGGAAGTAVGGPVGGAVGGILTGGAAMFAAPAALRESLIQAYKARDAQTPVEWLNALQEVAKATAKEAAIGAVTMGAGSLAARTVGAAVAPAIGQSITVGTGTKLIGTADVAAQIAAMVTAPAAIQGHMPEAREFADAAAVILTLKAGHTVLDAALQRRTADRIASVYAKTGKSPIEQVADANRNPQVAEDLTRPEVDPMTGTTSGVPVKLDKIIAEAEFLARGGVPEAPDIKAIIKEIKDAGPQQGDMIADIERIGALYDQARQAPLTDPERAELEGLRARVARAGGLEEAPAATAMRFTEEQVAGAQAQAKARLAELEVKASEGALTDRERAERVLLTNGDAQAIARHFGLEPTGVIRITPEAQEASARRIHDDILRQLKDVDQTRRDAGLEPLGEDHAMAVAALVAARMRTRASRLGMLAEELYAERPLQIRDEASAEVRAAEAAVPEEAPRFEVPETDLFGDPIAAPMVPRHAIENLETREIPLKDLVLSKEVPQFKHAADQNGVIVPLGGRFDRTGVGPIQVWERADGTLEVISGRHRLDLARRSGEETIPAQIHREAEGFTAARAAALDAELNIREEQGSVADYVQHFKASGITKEAADELGLLARAKGRAGFAIARDGTDDLRAAHRADRLSDEAALAISAAAPGSDRLQALGMAMVQEGKSILVAVNTMKAVDLMAAERMAKGAQGDIFGFDDSAMREASIMAKRASSMQRKISEQINAVAGASKRPELARKMGVDVQDPEGIQKRIVELRQEQTLWDNWPLHPELVARLRANAEPAGVTGREGDLKQEPLVALQKNKAGHPELIARDIALTKTRVFEDKGAPGVTYMDHVIVGPEGATGRVSLGWKGDKVEQLVWIHTDQAQQGRGFADAALRAILEHNGPGAELHIVNILKGARGWYENRGIKFFDTEGGEDGIATLEAYRAARAGRQAAQEGAGTAAQAESEGAGKPGAKPEESAPVTPPEFELKAETPAEARARDLEAAQAAERRLAEERRADLAKQGKKVTVDQADLFNTQGTLFQKELPRLSVLHNLDAGGLVFADKIGGLPVPSLGVVTEGIGIRGMGDITLIGKSHLGDPRAEPIHDADVYSPTFPRAEYSKVRIGVAQAMVDAMRPFTDRFDDYQAHQVTWDSAVNNPNPREIISAWTRGRAAKAMFLTEKGLDPKPKMRAKHMEFPWVKYLDFDEYRRHVPFNDERPIDVREASLVDVKQTISKAIDRYLAEDPQGKKLAATLGHANAKENAATSWGVRGNWLNAPGEPMPYSFESRIKNSHDAIGAREVDIAATEKRLNKMLEGYEAEFKQWVDDKVMSMFGLPFLRLGRRKEAYTLGNIVEVMSGRIKATQDTMTYGEGKARAAAAKKFNDLEQMRRYAAENILPEAEIETARAEVKSGLEAWRNGVVNYFGDRSSNEFGRVWDGLDSSMKALARWAHGGKTEENLRRALAAEGFDTRRLPDHLLEDGVEIGKLWLKAPVPYFEAKPQRAVNFNEFAGAVIPANTPPAARAVLEKHGIKIKEYDNTDAGAQERATVDFRRELAKQGEDVLFQEHRASYQIAERLITTMQGADKSSVVHELGHDWLEEMKADAARPDAPAALKADWETLRRELAIGEDGEISRSSHEQFARSVERYLAEGEAPSVGLRGVFERFRAWLLEIYQSLANLNVRINPELKEVLDRMLATDQEIADARALGVPRAYVAEARATEAAKIVPEPRKIDPGFKAEQASMEPFADELPRGPGEAPDNTHVNYAYINSPTAVKLAMQKMAEIDQAHIQELRGGEGGVKTWEAANAEQAKYLNDILGGSEDTLRILSARAPGEHGPDVKLGIMKKLAVGAAEDSARLRDIVLAAGHDATVRQQLEYMGSIERMRLLQAEFLAERAGVARALNALKDTTEGSDEIGKILDVIGYGEAAKRANTFFQEGRTPAEEQAYMKAKLDEILQNYRGRSVLDIAKLHKEIGTLKGSFKLAKEVEKATTWEMLIEGWKSALLSGPVTHTTNLFGTGAFMAMRPAVDALAAVIGMARGASPGMGESDRASMSEAVARLTGMLGGVQDGLRAAKAAFDIQDPTGKTESYRNAIPGRAGELIRVPLRLMGAEDAMVSTMYARGELRTLAIRKAFDEGLSPSSSQFAARVERLIDQPTPEMKVAAETAATRMTFNMPLGEKGVYLQLFVNKWNLQWMIPFIRTPINITKELGRMSPFAPLVGEWRADIAKGGIARDRAIAEAALGAGIMAITMAYTFSGDISGSGSPDPGKNRAKAGVWQPNSWKVGDTWYEYQRIQPMGTLMGLSADLAEAWDHMTDEEKDKVPKMLARAFANAVTNQTFLQGITNVINAMSDPTRFAPRFLQQLAGSMVPNVIGQPTTMADPTVRQVEGALQAIQARIPGLRQELLPKRDWLGEEVKTKERLGIIGPVRILPIADDKVRKEAARLEISVAEPPKKVHIGQGTGKIGDVELTQEERDKFATTAGRMVNGILTKVVSQPGYEQIPDMIKRRIFQRALEAAHRVAAVDALPPDKRQAYLQQITEKVARELAPAPQ